MVLALLAFWQKTRKPLTPAKIAILHRALQFFMFNVTFPLTRRRRKGFSFIEVMVVIMILGLLVGIVGVSLFDSASQATVDATKTQIRGLETALDLYRLHNGRYPTTDQKLSALLERPEVGIIPKKDAINILKNSESHKYWKT